MRIDVYVFVGVQEDLISVPEEQINEFQFNGNIDCNKWVRYEPFLARAKKYRLPVLDENGRVDISEAKKECTEEFAPLFESLGFKGGLRFNRFVDWSEYPEVDFTTHRPKVSPELLAIA